ncbi:MAG: hypothetical protein ABEJ56_05555 [Candidatus Nanohaloarchaea archaeon]
MNTKQVKSRAVSYSREKPVMAALLGLMVLGGGTAAVQEIVSPTVSGTASVSTGMKYEVTGVTGNDSTVTGSQSFTVSPGASGTFSATFEKENLANEETSALVEAVVISSSQAMQKENLENVTFTYEQTAPSSAGPFLDYLSRYSDGSVRTDATGRNLYVGEADVTGEGTQDVVVCIGENNGTPGKYDSYESDGDISDGVNFDSGEAWTVDYSFDTQSGFPTESVSVESYLTTLFNPESGGLSDVAAACPQFDAPA